MALSSPAARMAAAGALLSILALAFTPVASAQLPVPVDGDPRAAAIGFVVICPQTLLSVGFLKAVDVDCNLHDLTRDSVVVPGAAGGTSAVGQITTLEIVNETSGVLGYQVLLSRNFIPTAGGDVVPFTIRVQTNALVNSQDFAFELMATFTGPDGEKQNQTTPFHAEVERFDRALVEIRMDQKVQRAGQNDIVQYELSVKNDGVYPDSYRIVPHTDADIRVSQPPNVYVPPGETRNVTLSLLTPKGKLYELGRSTQLNVKVSSVTGTGVYTTVGTLQIRGPYVPTSWFPLTLVGLISAGILVQRTRERAEIRRLEKGRPRRVEPTPRQAALLAELRRQDPEAYKAKRAAMGALYASRKEEWRDHRKERLAADREEAKRARAEFKAAKKRKALAAKERRAQEKRDAKARKIQERLDAKERKKKEKVLGRKRKVLEKERAKVEKREGKLAAKQAKVDAKAARVEAKRAAVDEKARLKAEKAAARAARKGGGKP